MAKTDAEKRDEQRAADRAAELKKQDEVNAAMEKFYKASTAEAQKALREQIDYEERGIRHVEGKP